MSCTSTQHPPPGGSLRTNSTGLDGVLLQAAVRCAQTAAPLLTVLPQTCCHPWCCHTLTDTPSAPPLGSPCLLPAGHCHPLPQPGGCVHARDRAQHDPGPGQCSPGRQGLRRSSHDCLHEHRYVSTPVCAFWGISRKMPTLAKPRFVDRDKARGFHAVGTPFKGSEGLWSRGMALPSHGRNRGFDSLQLQFFFLTPPHPLPFPSCCSFLFYQQ